MGDDSSAIVSLFSSANSPMAAFQKSYEEGMRANREAQQLKAQIEHYHTQDAMDTLLMPLKLEEIKTRIAHAKNTTDMGVLEYQQKQKQIEDDTQAAKGIQIGIQQGLADPWGNPVIPPDLNSAGAGALMAAFTKTRGDVVKTGQGQAAMNDAINHSRDFSAVRELDNSPFNRYVIPDYGAAQHLWDTDANLRAKGLKSLQNSQISQFAVEAKISPNDVPAVQAIITDPKNYILVNPKNPDSGILTDGAMKNIQAETFDAALRRNADIAPATMRTVSGGQQRTGNNDAILLKKAAIATKSVDAEINGIIKASSTTGGNMSEENKAKLKRLNAQRNKILNDMGITSEDLDAPLPESAPNDKPKDAPAWFNAMMKQAGPAASPAAAPTPGPPKTPDPYTASKNEPGSSADNPIRIPVNKVLHGVPGPRTLNGVFYLLE